MSFEESLKVIKHVEARRDFDSYVPLSGISLNFMLMKLLHTKDERTMYDLESYVIEQTKRWQHCSFTEMLEHHPTYKSCVKTEADYFVSFAYVTKFDTILSALDKFRRKVGAENIFVWISIFTVNQHFARKKGEVAAVVYPRKWFKTAFRKTIPVIETVLFVMSPLKEPVALQRLWCIYELYLSISHENCTLDVVLSEEDEQYFIDNLLEDSRSVLQYINGVDSKSAKTSNPDDEQKLREQIEGIAGGYNGIDDSVREKLRSWLAQAATLYISDRKSQYREDKVNYIELLEMVAKMLDEAGKVEEAFLLTTECLEECKAHYGDDALRCVAIVLSKIQVHLTHVALIRVERQSQCITWRPYCIPRLVKCSVRIVYNTPCKLIWVVDFVLENNGQYLTATL